MQQKSKKKANVQKVFWDWDYGQDVPEICIFNESGDKVFTWAVSMEVTSSVVLSQYVSHNRKI